MTFLEKNLEDIIFETRNDLLCERGLLINGIKKRQVVIGNYGICDIITLHRVPHDDAYVITVFELKKDQVNVGTLLQAIRYCRGIKSYLFKKRKTKFQIKIVLIGSSVDKTSDFVYMTDVISNRMFSLNVYEYSYQFDGIYFELVSGYRLINEGF